LGSNAPGKATVAVADRVRDDCISFVAVIISAQTLQNLLACSHVGLST
jgi:hypothetical protein